MCGGEDRGADTGGSVQEWVVIVGGECSKRVQAGSRWRPAAHPEHAAHVRDAGRVEVQRLVERQRALPSRKEGVRCGARCGPGGGTAWVGGSA